MSDPARKLMALGCSAFGWADKESVPGHGNGTGQQHCVLDAEAVDGPGGMFTLGVCPPSREISGVELINKIRRALGR
jgi:hypothetical protein